MLITTGLGWRLTDLLQWDSRASCHGARWCCTVGSQVKARSLVDQSKMIAAPLYPCRGSLSRLCSNWRLRREGGREGGEREAGREVKMYD